mmetsp:Transcript_83885/g.264825  ORF Transcript_83885/g.264825 Transcript_83885/m.264825 type:complete len:305 (+) Transcript_83885:2-916(+)
MSSNLFISHSSGASLKNFGCLHRHTGYTLPVTLSLRPASQRRWASVPSSGGGPKPPQIPACWFTQNAHIQYVCCRPPQASSLSLTREMRPSSSCASTSPYSARPMASATTAATRTAKQQPQVCVTMLAGSAAPPDRTSSAYGRPASPRRESGTTAWRTTSPVVERRGSKCGMVSPLGPSLSKKSSRDKALTLRPARALTFAFHASEPALRLAARTSLTPPPSASNAGRCSVNTPMTKKSDTASTSAVTSTLTASISSQYCSENAGSLKETASARKQTALVSSGSDSARRTEASALHAQTFSAWV